MEEGTPRRGASPELISAQVCQALNAAGARYLVIGGIACILHGYVRATSDLDVLIERSPDNAERVLDGLARAGYGFAREWTAKELLARPVTVIGDDPAVDVFTVAWTVKYEEAAPRAISAEVEGVVIPFIGLDDLIASKRTGRLQDAADIEVLEEIKRGRAGRGEPRRYGGTAVRRYGGTAVNNYFGPPVRSSPAAARSTSRERWVLAWDRVTVSRTTGRLTNLGGRASARLG